MSSSLTTVSYIDVVVVVLELLNNRELCMDCIAAVSLSQALFLQRNRHNSLRKRETE